MTGRERAALGARGAATRPPEHHGVGLGRIVVLRQRREVLSVHVGRVFRRDGAHRGVGHGLPDGVERSVEFAGRARSRGTPAGGARARGAARAGLPPPVPATPLAVVPAAPLLSEIN